MSGSVGNYGQVLTGVESVLQGLMVPNAVGLMLGNPTGGLKGPGTLNLPAGSLFLDGTAVTTGGGVTVPTAPLLKGVAGALASVTAIDGLVIGGVDPAAGTFTGLQATGNVSLTGLASGNAGGIGLGISSVIGASAGPAYVFTTVIDHSILPAGIRQNQLATILNPSIATNNPWQNEFSIVTVNGPGASNGEISAHHGQIIVNSGASYHSGEPFESRIDNTGTILAIQNYLATSNNNVGGSIASMTGLFGGLSNADTTAGAVQSYTFLNMGPMGGGGSLPTTYRFMENGDIAASSVLLGPLAIGSLVSTAAKFTVTSPGTTAGTFNTLCVNGASANLLILEDSGDLVIPLRVSIGQATAGTATLQIKGADSAHGSFALFCSNSSGITTLALRNDGSCAVSGAWTFGSASSPGNISFVNTVGGTQALTANTTSASGSTLRLPVPTGGTDILVSLTSAPIFTSLVSFSAHIAGSGTIPTINSGGTLDAHASDVAGTVTTTTASTGFVVTFAAAYATAPHVVISSPSGNVYTSYTVSTTSITLVCAALSGAIFTYQVVQ